MTPPTILVVEHDPMTREMLRITLETEGYAVVEATDGRSALAEAERELPALILQDQGLPDMSGFELTRQLREIPGGSIVPIVSLSGSIDPEQAPNVASGWACSLVKPIEPARLIDVVRSHVPRQVTRVEDGGGRRVLVVDDDPIQLKLTSLHLQLLGFEVTSAFTVAEALRLAMAEVPDAILSDVLLPEVDGFQLCIEVRKEPKLRRVPVLLASAWYETEADRELARRVGATALVRKTPDLGDVAPLLLAAMKTAPQLSGDALSVEVRLSHAEAVVRQLQLQVSASAHLARRCTLQATQISLLGGTADALTSNTDADAALHDILGATLDAAGLPKGVLYLQNERGELVPRHAIGFGSSERARLDDFFGQMAELEEAVRARTTLVIPTTILRRALEASILAGAGASSAQIVPLTSEGRGVGALILFAGATDVTSDDSIAFARAMGSQLAQSLALASSFARLTASERRYRAVTDAANDAISILRPDGVIVDINPSFEATLGRGRNQIVGHKIDEFAATSGEWESLPMLSAPPSASPAIGSPVPLARSDGTVALMEFSLPGEAIQAASAAGARQRADARGTLRSLSMTRDREGVREEGESMETALECVFDTTPLSLVLFDEPGHIVLANRRLEAMLGYPRPELVGCSVDVLLAQASQVTFARRRAELIGDRSASRANTTRIEQLHVVRRDGTEFVAALSLHLVEDDGRRMLIATVLDDTDSVGFVDFRVALDAAPTGMLLVDGRGLIVLVNNQIEKIFGYPREELIGRSLERLVPVSLSARHEGWRQGFFEKASNRPMGAGRDLYGLHRDGHAVPVEIALTTLDAVEGRLVLTSVIDITERKRVELALRENEQRYSEFFSDSPVALFEQDFSETRAYLMDLVASGVKDIGAYLSEHPDAVLAAAAKVKAVMMNQHALQLLGAKQESELRSVLPFFCQETFAWLQAGLCELMAGARYFSRETRARTLTGRMLTVSKQMHLLPGHRDTWSRVVVSLFDLTAHDRAEELLRSALREKEVLLREVHHRVKNNLQIVSSLLSMKGEGVEDLVTRQMFADCQHRVRSLAFVHEQLYWSDDLAHVSFDRYLRTMVEHLKNSFRGSVESVTSQVDAGDISLSIDDAIPCGLIINELVTNSLKHAFSPNGGGHIRVRMRKLDAQHLELVVSDNGRGLPPGFDPLQNDSSGLELVYTFVEQLQAEMEVSSVGGTTFTLRFVPGASARARAEPS